MGCMSAYSAPAVAHPAPVTGGTLNLIWVPPLCFTPIGKFISDFLFLVCYFLHSLEELLLVGFHAMGYYCGFAC